MSANNPGMMNLGQSDTTGDDASCDLSHGSPFKTMSADSEDMDDTGGVTLPTPETSLATADSVSLSGESADTHEEDSSADEEEAIPNEDDFLTPKAKQADLALTGTWTMIEAPRDGPTPTKEQKGKQRAVDVSDCSEDDAASESNQIEAQTAQGAQGGQGHSNNRTSRRRRNRNQRKRANGANKQRADGEAVKTQPGPSKTVKTQPEPTMTVKTEAVGTSNRSDVPPPEFSLKPPPIVSSINYRNKSSPMPDGAYAHQLPKERGGTMHQYEMPGPAYGHAVNPGRLYHPSIVNTQHGLAMFPERYQSVYPPYAMPFQPHPGMAPYPQHGGYVHPQHAYMPVPGYPNQHYHQQHFMGQMHPNQHYHQQQFMHPMHPMHPMHHMHHMHHMPPMGHMPHGGPQMMPHHFPAPVPGGVPLEIQVLRSPKLNNLTNTPSGLPLFSTAINVLNFPFVESCSQSRPSNFGVVRIENIPFQCSRAEVIGALGRHPYILNDRDEPVHIVMDRITGKTTEAYVEFVHVAAAIKAVERHDEHKKSGPSLKIGDRTINMEMSSADELLKILFPLAHSVSFSNGIAHVEAKTHSEDWGDFKGFVTEEEMTMLVKQVEIPQRSPYTRECPQRPYECLISTIKKFPWYLPEHTTIRQRNAIYKAAHDMLKLLIEAINEGKSPELLNDKLRKRLADAILSCPGFSVSQRDSIAYIAGTSDYEMYHRYNLPRGSQEWAHQFAICPKLGIPSDVVEWYIALIREESTKYVHGLEHAQAKEVLEKGEKTSSHWGYMWHEMGFPIDREEFEAMSLHAVALLELKTIDRILRRSLPGSLPPSLPPAGRMQAPC